jgi:thioredoxin-related protein
MSSRRRPWMLLLVGCCAAAVAWRAGAQELVAPGIGTPGIGIQWRSEYTQALIESERRGLPLVVDFTTKPCFWCDKLDQTTFRDPRIINLINQNYVPLRISADRDPKLAQEMRIAAYPTLVLAGPGRKILYMREGYHDAETFHEILQRHSAQVATPDWMKQHFDLAQKSYQDGDYARACASLKNILEDSQGRSIHPSAQRLLQEIEARANERLARAKDLINNGRSMEAVQSLTETLATFAGLPASKEAGELLTKLAQHSEQRLQQRARRAGELIVQARDFYRNKDIVPCLDRCEILIGSYGDLPEGGEASQLIQEIRNNQEWLQLAADTLGDRLASVYLALADSKTKRNQPREAEVFLRRVIQAFPGSRYAESAQIRIGQLQGIPTNRVIPTGGPE